MSRARKVPDIVERQRIMFITQEVVSELHPLIRLTRASDDIRAGRSVVSPDRRFIADLLDQIYMRERKRKRKRSNTSMIADELARRAKIPRELAAAHLVRSGAKIPALVRAIARVRSRGRGRKARKSPK
jgi:hypothetical protein